MVIAPSQFILELFKKEGFFKNCKKSVLPYGIELEEFTNYYFKRIKVDNKDSFNVLYVGSLAKHKGVQILIEAVKQIKNRNVKLIIVGDGVYEEELKSLAGNDRRILFYGKVNNVNIKSLYHTADVLVVPSIWYEVLGIVIQESFRAGVPAIGSSIGGIPELIKENYNGFLFKRISVDQLKEILENIISNPGRLIELGKNAQEFIKKDEMSEHIKKIVEIYKEAIEINRVQTI